MTEPSAIDEVDRHIVRYIVDHHRQHGYPPTMAAIGAEVGLSSKSGVYDRLRRLEEAGVIKRVTRGKTTLRIDVLEMP